MLEVRNLGVRYGRHQALDGVALTVDRGEICVILGANGAGKSSLLKAIAGTVRAEPGSAVVMNGVPLIGLKPHKIVEHGVALVPEGRGIFGELTVAENLELGAFPNRARSHERATLESIYTLFPRLAERKSQTARTMSGGEQQMVAIGRALMSRPDILMLDEPSLGLSPVLTKELFRALATIAAGGLGILLVEQNARRSLKIAGRGYLIEVGRITGEGSAQRLMTDPAVVNAYLGGARRSVKEAGPRVRLPAGPALPLDIAGLGRLIAGLAGRADAIRAAFVRALRQAAPLPSAFAGRYDPKKEGDAWAMLAAGLPNSRQSTRGTDDGRRLAGQAGDLARNAALRQTRHIRALRASQANPSAFVGIYDPATALVGLDASDPVTLAHAAARRMADHISRRRLSAEAPSAFALASAKGPETAHGVHPALGHNSRGLDIDVQEDVNAARQPGLPLDIDALVTRAAQRQSQHVAARRRLLTITTLAPRALPQDPAKKSGPDTQ